MNIPVKQGELTFEQQCSKVIRLQLTPDQADQLAPLAIDAARSHQNLLFVATVMPFWSQEEAATIWELQTTAIPAKIGHKLKKLILETNAQSERKAGS